MAGVTSTHADAIVLYPYVQRSSAGFAMQVMNQAQVLIMDGLQSVPGESGQAQDMGRNALMLRIYP